MLIDVLVLLFLVVAVKLIPPLNRRFAALWQRSVVGKLLVIVIAFLAMTRSSSFLLGLKDAGLGWWETQAVAFMIVAAIISLILWLGGRGKRSNPGATRS
jgi:uncharacterized membrane protein